MIRALPSCTYSFLGRINHTAQPWLPEVPLPGLEPSAPLASLSLPLTPSSSWVPRVAWVQG